MCIKKFAAVILTAVIFAGCTAQTAEEENIPQEEKERAAIASWFAESMTDEESFPDVKDYQYYARAVGLDKDALLSPDMWEVYYNDEININREIDGKAIYLIRLDPDKLLEIYAANNNSTAEGIVCGVIGAVVLLAMVIVRRKMTNDAPIEINGKTVGIVIYGIFSTIVFGIGMCMTMVWSNLMLPGIIIGIIGIVLLLCLIPMIKGIN